MGGGGGGGGDYGEYGNNNNNNNNNNEFTTKHLKLLHATRPDLAEFHVIVEIAVTKIVESMDVYHYNKKLVRKGKRRGGVFGNGGGGGGGGRGGAMVSPPWANQNVSQVGEVSGCGGDWIEEIIGLTRGERLWVKEMVLKS